MNNPVSPAIAPHPKAFPEALGHGHGIASRIHRAQIGGVARIARSTRDDLARSTPSFSGVCFCPTMVNKVPTMRGVILGKQRILWEIQPGSIFRTIDRGELD